MASTQHTDTALAALEVGLNLDSQIWDRFMSAYAHHRESEMKDEAIENALTFIAQTSGKEAATNLQTILNSGTREMLA